MTPNQKPREKMTNKRPLRVWTDKELEATVARIKANRKPPIRNFIDGTEIDMSGSEGSLPSYLRAPNPLGIDVGGLRPKGKFVLLDAKKCADMFGVREAVKMNFIPQMITSLAMQQATELVNYCRDHRVVETKKHTRVLKTAVEEYAKRLLEAYGPSAFEAYARYTRRFHDGVGVQVRLMEMHADTLAKNQKPGRKHYPIFVRALVAVMLIKFCWSYDKEMDKMISSRIGRDVSNGQDVYQRIIHDICLSLALDLGYRVDPDKTMGDWVAVLSNKAWLLADEIIGEEAANIQANKQKTQT